MRTAALTLLVLAGIILATSTVSGANPMTAVDASPDRDVFRHLEPLDAIHADPSVPGLQQPAPVVGTNVVTDNLHLDTDLVIQSDDGAHEPTTVPEPQIEIRAPEDRSWPTTALRTILGLVHLFENH